MKKIIYKHKWIFLIVFIFSWISTIQASFFNRSPLPENNELKSVTGVQAVVTPETLVYGYATYSGVDGGNKGFVRFPVNSPDKLEMFKVENTNGKLICVGEYANEKWYAFTYRYPETAYDSFRLTNFGTIDLETGNFSALASATGDVLNDMAYDYSTSTMYAIQKHANGPLLTKINLNSEAGILGIQTVVGYVTGGPVNIVAMACDLSGQLYGIDDQAALYKIDKNTLGATRIGSTGKKIPNNDQQTLAFDHYNNVLYWTGGGEGKLYKVDVSTAAVTPVGYFSENPGVGYTIVSLLLPYEHKVAKAPNFVDNLTATSGENGALSLSLQWKNPATAVDGTSLSGLSSVEVYRNGGLVKTFPNPTPGSVENWSDPSIINGYYTYKIIPKNTMGEGRSKTVKIFVGVDTPKPVGNLVLTNNSQKKAQLTWTAPTEGVNKGYIGNITYDIVRMPQNVKVAENYSGTSYTDNNSLSYANYYYTVIAKNASASSEVVNSNTTVIGENILIPWKETFTFRESDLALWTLLDLDGDSKSFAFYVNYGDDANALREQGNTTPGKATDDWLISPPVYMESGKTYMLKWKDRNQYNTTDRKAQYDITFGNNNTTEAQNNILGTYTAESYYYSEQDVFLPSVTTSGVYHIGWHVHGQQQTRSLVIKDFSIVEVSGTDMQLISFTGNSLASVGIPHDFKVVVRNYGSTAASDFSVKLFDNEGAELASTSYIGTLSPGETTEISVKWTPASESLTALTLKATVVANGDQNPDNDSATLEIKRIFPFGSIDVKIGEDNTGGVPWYYLPFNLYDNGGVSQVIYRERDIPMSGLIESVSYFTEFSLSSVSSIEVPVKIWMTKTTSTTFLNVSNWTREAVLVYEGNVTFPNGQNSVKIILDKPFYYDGKDNILIWTQRMNGAAYGGGNTINFKNAKLTYAMYDNIGLYWKTNSTSTDFNFQDGSRVTYFPQTLLSFNVNGSGLSGTVSDENGIINGASVKIQSEGGQSFETTTNDEGKYDFPFLPSGNHTVIVHKVGYTQLNQPIVIDLNAKVADFELEEVEKVNVSGKVLDELAIPLENAVIILKNASENYTVLTDENGEFLIQAAVNNTYNLSVFRSGYVIPADEEVEVEIMDLNLPDVVLSSCSGRPIDESYFEFKVNDPEWYYVTLNWRALNSGTQTIKGYRIYRNNLPVNTELLASSTITFSEKLSPGNYTYSIVAVWDNNGVICESERVSTIPIVIEISPCDIPVTIFPFKEGFESERFAECWQDIPIKYMEGEIEFTPPYWTFWKGGGDDAPVPSEVYNGNISLRMFSTRSFKQNGGIKRQLVLPPMNLSALQKPVLSFVHAQAAWFGQDTLRVLYKNSFEGEWKEIIKYNYTIKEWTQEVIDLPDPTDNYWIKFEGIITGGHGIVLDDLMVSDNSCQPVTNLRFNQLKEKNVELLWNAPDGFDYTSYKVKRDGIVIADNLEETVFIDKDLPLGTYNYEVIAYYDKEDCSESSARTLAVTLQKLCDPIEEVNIEVLSSSSLKLTWEAPNALDVSSYTVERDGVVVASQITNTEHTETDLVKGDYTYCVYVNYDDKTCNKSAGKCSTISLVCEPVSNLSQKVEFNNKVTLTWETEADDIATFNIYREKELIATVRENLYIDTNMTPGTTLEYCVKPVYDIGCEGGESCTSVVFECVDVTDLAVNLTSNETDCTAELTWKLAGENSPRGENQMVYDNGSIRTHDGTGFNGADESITSGGDTEPGFSLMYSLLEYAADDFILTNETQINEIEFFAYLNNAPLNPNYFDQVYVSIYDRSPSEEGAKLLWGDNSTNVYKSAEFANIFRVLETESHGLVQRPVFSVKAEIDCKLPAGKYWLMVSLNYNQEVLLGSPYIVPVTITNQLNTGNAMYRQPYSADSGWRELVDAGTHSRKGIGFRVYGEPTPETFNIYRDGKLIAEKHEGNSYTDENVPQGTRTWSVEHVCKSGLATAKKDVTDKCEGVSIESDTNNRLNIYPNPARSAVIVEGDNIERIDIINITGITIESILTSGNTKQNIDVSKYVPGVYIFRIYTSDGNVSSRNVMVIE